MISGKDVYNVLASIVPLYVAMILAYGAVRWWNILTPDQCSGINRFVVVFAVPLMPGNYQLINNTSSGRKMSGDEVLEIEEGKMLPASAPPYSSGQKKMDMEEAGMGKKQQTPPVLDRPSSGCCMLHSCWSSWSSLRVSILQAALPLAIVPFVFAKEYNVHAEIISTSVIFGMLVALPVTIVYYILLGLVSGKLRAFGRYINCTVRTPKSLWAPSLLWAPKGSIHSCLHWLPL
ncbi:hypothetical protein ACLB2K_055106 [Fragaria x ananassa]